LLPDESIAKKCDYFVKKGKEDSDWAFNNIVRFLQFQKERVEQKEITDSNQEFSKSYKIIL
jgi:hypothetical protein